MTMTTKEKLESKSSHNRNRLRASLREKEAIIACIYMCVCVWEKDIETLNTLNGSIEIKESVCLLVCKKAIIIVDEKPI